MKKAHRTPKIQDHIDPQAYKTNRSRSPRAEQFYTDTWPAIKRRRISYIPGAEPQQEAASAQQLCIRGLIGGRITIDLRGLGVKLSEEAFGQWVVDEALGTLHIHRGDIAIIDPLRPILRTGNVVLTLMGGRETFSCLRKRARVWYLEPPDGRETHRVMLVEQPLYGAVVGFLRLFTRVKAVRRGRGTFDLKPFAKMHSDGRRSSKPVPKPAGSPRQTVMGCRPSAKQKGVVLLAEKATDYHRKLRR